MLKALHEKGTATSVEISKATDVAERVIRKLLSTNKYGYCMEVGVRMIPKEYGRDYVKVYAYTGPSWILRSFSSARAYRGCS